METGSLQSRWCLRKEVTPMPLTQCRITAFYERRKKLISKLCKSHQEKYGGKWDELMSEANYLFTKACHTWDPHKGKLSTHVGFRVRVGLMDLRRRKAKGYARQMASLNEIEYHPPTPGNGTFLVDLMDELEKDARIIVNCLLMPDLDLELYLSTRSGSRAVKRALREYFSYEEWAGDRITAAFCNITEALSPQLAN